MEQKINVLVQNVSKSVTTVLQVNPASSSNAAGVALVRDVAALERLVSASIAALKNIANANAKATPPSPVLSEAQSRQQVPGNGSHSPMRVPPPPPSRR